MARKSSAPERPAAADGLADEDVRSVSASESGRRRGERPSPRPAPALRLPRRRPAAICWSCAPRPWATWRCFPTPCGRCGRPFPGCASRWRRKSSSAPSSPGSTWPFSTSTCAGSTAPSRACGGWRPRHGGWASMPWPTCTTCCVRRRCGSRCGCTGFPWPASARGAPRSGV